jgi:transcriptional regulator with XRE-family HTH domain
MQYLHLKNYQLKRLRQMSGFTQEEIAEKMKISQATYARLESGNIKSWTKYLDELCEIFQKDPIFFIEEEVFILESNKSKGTFIDRKAS